jgi:hypothetical protein
LNAKTPHARNESDEIDPMPCIVRWVFFKRDPIGLYGILESRARKLRAFIGCIKKDLLVGPAK